MGQTNSKIARTRESKDAVLLSIFGKQENVDTLIHFSRNDILAFLKSGLRKMRKAPGEYQWISDKKQLQKAYNELNEFDWDSKYRCFTAEDAGGPEETTLVTKVWKWMGREVPFCTVYDVLGYILSIISQAPTRPDTFNFYMPLLTVYTRWCSALEGPEGANGPTTTFITWVSDPEAQVVCGTSQDISSALMGSTIPKPRDKVDKILYERKNWMTHACDLSFIKDKDRAPKSKDNEGTRQIFGHCAETLPLSLNLRRLGMDKRKLLRGFALNRGEVDEISTYDTAEVIDCITDPCSNCRYLMKEKGADPEKFKQKYIQAEFNKQGSAIETVQTDTNRGRQTSRSRSKTSARDRTRDRTREDDERESSQSTERNRSKSKSRSRSKSEARTTKTTERSQRKKTTKEFSTRGGRLVDQDPRPSSKR